jgi:16S rRNA (uracil1498-N3)-methyltransferase
MSAAAIVRGQRMERWRRIAIASAKQCGRAVVPLVRPPTPFAACIARDATGTQLVFVEPDQRVSTGAVYNVPRPETATFFVGPEGGWTDAELGVAHDLNAQLVTLGGLTLRADAMPLVALTALRTVWKDL